MSAAQVLILDGHSRAALECLQALGRAGLLVDFASTRADVLGVKSIYVRQNLRQPPTVPAGPFLEWLSALNHEHGYQLIIASTEAALLALRDLPEEDPLRHKAMIPSNRALDLALNKEATWRLADELSIPVPPSRLITRTADMGRAAMPFPLVLKPIQSKVRVDGSLRTLAPALVNDESSRQRKLMEWLPLTSVQEQQFVPGHGVGLEFIYWHGRKLWHFAHRRLHEMPLTGGASTYRQAIEPPPMLLEAGQRLLDALAWHGVAMVEFRQSSDGHFFLMEINPRLWGSLALTIDAGMNLPWALWQLALGQQPGPQPRYRVGYRTRSLVNDLDWMKANLLADHQNPLLLTQSRLGAALEWFRPISGRESWDHFDWRDRRVCRALALQAFSDLTAGMRKRVSNKLLGWKIQRAHQALMQAKSRTNSLENVLFLCYGNICRSPFAAARARHLMAKPIFDSAGFHEHEGRRCPANIMNASRQMGLDLGLHRSKRADQILIDQADLILVMDLANYQYLSAAYPQAIKKTTLLGLFAPQPRLEIEDPYNQDEPATRQVLEQIMASVDGLEHWLASHGLRVRQTPLVKSPAGSPDWPVSTDEPTEADSLTRA